MPNTIDRRMRLKVAFAPQAIATSGAHTIAEMRWFPVQEPVSGSRYSFLRVKTRSGLTGWGECAQAAIDSLRQRERAIALRDLRRVCAAGGRAAACWKWVASREGH